MEQTKLPITVVKWGKKLKKKLSMLVRIFSVYKHIARVFTQKNRMIYFHWRIGLRFSKAKISSRKKRFRKDFYDLFISSIFFIRAFFCVRWNILLVLWNILPLAALTGNIGILTYWSGVEKQLNVIKNARKNVFSAFYAINFFSIEILYDYFFKQNIVGEYIC